MIAETRFDIKDLKKFDKPSPSFDEPTEIGYFSLDIKRTFKMSCKKSLRYFIIPENPERVTFDLRKGYDTMIKNTNERDKETHLFEWIKEDRKKKSNQEDATRPKEGASGSDKPMKCAPSKKPINEDKDLGGLQSELSKTKISTKETPDTPIPADRINRATEGPLGNDIPGNKQENPDPFSVQDQDPVNVDQEPATGISEVDISTKDKRKLDFVCRRGVLEKIMCSPYEDKEGWLIAVKRHNGTYYLHEFETEQKKEAAKKMTEKQKKKCCMGWKFEQYITAGTKDGKPKPDEVYNNCEAFYTVVEAKLNDHSLVFSGEIDALHDENENSSYYTEFKTSGRLTTTDQVKYFKRHTLNKWWAQSYIIGVKEIVCGFKDNEGIVHRLKIYKTEELPEYAEKDVDEPWKQKVCLNALDQFLTFIKSSITTEDTSKVHTLTWTPGQLVQCEPTEDPKYNFLPDGFTDVVD